MRRQRIDLPLPVPQTPPPAGVVRETVLGWLAHSAADAVLAQTRDWTPEHVAVACRTLWAQGIGPFLRLQLHGTPAYSALPSALQSYLAEDYRHNALRVRRMQEAVAQVVEAARDEGVTAMPLKGSVLSAHYYADPALRPMADVDVLVHSQDLARATAAVQGLGYEPLAESPKHLVLAPPGFTGALARHGIHEDNPWVLEIHTMVREQYWGLGYDLTELLWSSAFESSLGPTMATVPGLWALAAHVVVHASEHAMRGTGRAMQLLDVSVLALRLDDAAWEHLVRDTSSRGLSRLLYVPLVLAKRLLAVFVPDDVLAALAADTPARLRRMAREAPVSRFLNTGRPPRRLRVPCVWYHPGREWLLPLAALAHRRSRAPGGDP